MDLNTHSLHNSILPVDQDSREREGNQANPSRKCPICSSWDTSAPFWKKPRFHQCQQCGLIFRDPFPTVARLSHLYTTSWMSPDENKAETGATEVKSAQSLLKFLIRSIGNTNLSGKRILDFGAGRGAMALALRRKGAQVVAVEPFGYECLAKLGVSTYRDLKELPREARFDGIVSLEVLEHLPEPRQTLLDIHQHLAPGGWLFITTPNAAGLPAKFRGERWREAVRPGHVLFFTPRTLRSLLFETGFYRVERPRWLVRYTGSMQMRTILNFALQSVLADGGLRVLAFKN
jgi:2-polyprenyl-3-methyl-5-hydroxy-6-metoxy-1,4-benzoquinol methylase